LRLATLDWEPYAGQAPDNKGFNADIVTEAFKRAGYQVKIDVLPWDRAIEEALKGNYDGAFPEYYSKERSQDFVYSHSFSDSLLVFYKRYETSVTYKTLKDLRPYKIGTVRGQINTDEFDNAVYLMKIEADSDEENLRKLAKGDLDLIVIDKFVAQYLTKTKVPEAAGKISPIEPPLIIRNLFVILPKKNPDAERRARGFNKALDSMIKDGTVKAIMTGAGLTK
jgi:polar amino acid transport system substrate-binding protein